MGAGGGSRLLPSQGGHRDGQSGGDPWTGRSGPCGAASLAPIPVVAVLCVGARKRAITHPSLPDL